MSTSAPRRRPMLMRTTRDRMRVGRRHFTPRCAQNGEVASSESLPVAELVRLVWRHANDEVRFEPGVAVVFVDFPMRHGGFVEPDEDGYLELNAEPRRAECR